MRKGRYKRLAKPKRGKAADIAAFRGQGKEVHRGRSVFKRSAQNGNQNHYDIWDYVSRHKLRMDLRQDSAVELRHFMMIADEDDDMYSCMPPFMYESEDDDYARDELTLGKIDTLSESQSTESIIDIETPRSASLDSTWMDELGVESASGTSDASEMLRQAHFIKPPTLWEIALARAQKNAEVYLDSETVVDACTQAHGYRRSRRAHQNEPPPMLLKTKLRQHYDAHLVMPKRRSKDSSQFEAARYQFLEDHGENFCSRLRGCFGGPMSVKPTPLSGSLQNRFLTACSKLSGEIKPAFHGTDPSNLESIYSIGLIIPGQGNKFRVVNGAVHGRGIYTATMDDPMLSWGFARGATRPMLVCAVLDDAEDCDPHQLGIRTVTKESENVRHVGSAMVVFEPARVTPLFVVRHHGRSDNYCGVVKYAHGQVQQSPPPARRKKRKKVWSRMQKGGCILSGAVAFLSRRGACKHR